MATTPNRKKLVKKAPLTLEGLERTMQQGFDRIDRSVEALAQATMRGFASMEERMDRMEKDIKDVKFDVHNIHRELGDIHRRIERLEQQGASNAGFAVEIDTLMNRVAAIEKHLGIVQGAAH